MALGVVLTLVLVLRAVSQPQVETVDAAPGVLGFRLTMSLYTGNARPTQDAILTAVLAADPAPHTVVLDCAALRRVTVPLLDVLDGLEADLGEEGVELTVTGMSAAVAAAYARSR